MHNSNGHHSMTQTLLIAALWLVGSLFSVNHAATITYHHFDALGSPVASTDEAGNVTWREAYQPFGTRLRKETNDHTLWYTGKPTEEFYRVSYFGARWYNPEMGRFMAMDPVGVQEGNIHSFNRYTYGNNNPYRFFDPDGRESVESVKIRLRTGRKLAHPAGSSSASFPKTVQPVPGFSPPMNGTEAAATSLGLATAAGGVRELIKWGALKLLTKKEGATVIGRVKDLKNLKPGEKSLLDRLPDKGSVKINWKQNSSVLRQEMGKGKSIRDASPGNTEGQFLNAERNLLENRGWTFDKSTNFWNPPK